MMVVSGSIVNKSPSGIEFLYHGTSHGWRVSWQGNVPVPHMAGACHDRAMSQSLTWLARVMTGQCPSPSHGWLVSWQGNVPVPHMVGACHDRAMSQSLTWLARVMTGQCPSPSHGWLVSWQGNVPVPHMAGACHDRAMSQSLTLLPLCWFVVCGVVLPTDRQPDMATSKSVCLLNETLMSACIPTTTYTRRE